MKSDGGVFEYSCLECNTGMLKYSGRKDIPNKFMEAEWVFFGAHGLDLKSEGSKTGRLWASQINM